MYTKPKVERFGTFRELTLTGFLGTADNQGHAAVGGSGNGSGCDLLPNGVFCPAQS
jgi:hypothetical protein